MVLKVRVSRWLHVLSGVPQGSTQFYSHRCLLYLLMTWIMIVDKLPKFAHDTKLVGIVYSPTNELQLDLKNCSLCQLICKCCSARRSARHCILVIIISWHVGSRGHEIKIYKVHKPQAHLAV